MMTAEDGRRYDGGVSPIRKRDARVSRAFGRALKIARVRADLTREELARAAGLHRADEVGRFERGEREPALSVFMALSRALALSTGNLLAATEEELRDVRPTRRQAVQPEDGAKAGPEAKPEPLPLAMAVVVQAGSLLMTRRRVREKVIGADLDWNLVSGKVEAGETPEEAAVREVLEEVGLRVRAAARIYDHVHPRNPDGRRFYYIGCEVLDGAAELVDHEENREVRWCTLEEADEFVAPYGGFAAPVRGYIARAMAAVGSDR